MAETRICSIPDCNKPACNSRGWCHAHYWRWQKHGDPLGGGTAFGEPRKFYETVALKFLGDDCLLWPFGHSKGGYPQIWLNRQKRYVHRLVCEAHNGPPPDPNYETAHSCGNKSCVAKAHLSWKTHVENEADKVAHGTRLVGGAHSMARLSQSDISTIRALAGKVKQDELAARFGVTQAHISNIIRGQRWKPSP